MMLGELNFDDLYYPEKMIIKPNKTKSLINISNVELPDLRDADIETSPKPAFYPGTSILLIFIFILLVPIVALNLLVGLAVNDVKVSSLYWSISCIKIERIIYDNVILVIIFKTNITYSRNFKLTPRTFK